MHQMILDTAARAPEVIKAERLRLIRSSSASLPPQVMKALEDTFNAPVIESYGMTEAVHQMTSNPLSPLKDKPGSVGVAAGPEVAIIDEVGEVVIRGPNVMSGYQNNPEADAAAFTAGWFWTGDQDVMEADGYLSLTGRLKEIINRGGEKIMAAQAILRVEAAFGITVTLDHMFRKPTLAAQALIIEDIVLGEVEALEEDS